MTAIQIVLITGVLFILVYFLQRIQRAVFSVVFMTLLSGSAVFFILQPELTNKIAHYIGVGRGADLVFYTSILLFWYVILRLYARVRKLEERVTTLIRQDAINKSGTNV